MERIGIISLVFIFFFFLQSTVHSQFSSAEEQKVLKEGILLLGDGSYDGALEKFSKVAEINPANSDAHYYLGVVYSEVGEYQKAIHSYLEALRLNPELREVHFKLAVAYYELKQYREALQEFSEAKKYTPDDDMIYYYEGLSYYNIKRYHKSAPLFKKVRTLNPDLALYSHYWEGVSLFQQGLYKEAQSHLGRVRTDSPDSPLGNSADEFLQIIRDSTRPFGFDASWGVEYDDNVTLQPGDEDIETEISGKEDWRIVTNLKGTYRRFLKSGEFGVYYSFYQSLGKELSDYDLQGHTCSLYFSSLMRPFQPFIQYKYDYYFVDRERYLEKHSFKPSINITAWTPLITQFYWLYEKSNYLTSPLREEYNRDSESNSVGFDQYFLIMQDRGNIKIGGVYEENRARGEDWDYSSSEASLSIYLPLPLPRTTVMVSGEYEDKDFAHEDSYFEKVRNDEKLTAILEITYQINKRWNISLGYMYTDNNSNIDFYQYRRNITSLLASYSF